MEQIGAPTDNRLTPARYCDAAQPINIPEHQTVEMHQVRYFLAAADELNFTRAAERCDVAQPTMTRAI